MASKKSTNQQQEATRSTAFNQEISYMSLFPNTAFNNIGDAYSSTGVGAYFVSLMNLATNSDKIAPDVDDLSLKKRRPDLWTLEVSKKNTETTMPYLQKVIELLKLVVVGIEPDKLWEKVANCDTNFLPYNQPLQRIGSGLSVYNTSLAELASQFSPEDYNSLQWSLAELGLSYYELEILKHPEKKIKDWVAPEIKSPEQLRIAAGLDMEAMLLLIYNGQSSDEELKKLFINRSSSAPLKYKAYNGSDAEHFENMTHEHLNRIRQFLILANGTGWDFSTLNALLSTEHIWKENIEELEANLKRMAMLTHVSKALTLTPQSIIPVQAETGVLQTAAAISSTLAQDNKNAQINVLTDALRIDKSLVEQQQNQLAAPTQNILNVLLPLAARMGITVAQLELHLLFNKLETVGLEDLFSLVQLHDTLQKAGISLQQYIQVETATHYYVQSDVNFDIWLDVLRKKLTASESSHAGDKTQCPTEKRSKEVILKEEQAEENLQQLLFQQWTHELAVYWGEKEAAVYNTMLGLSKYFVEKSGTGNGIGQFNNFVRNEEKHTVKNLLRSLFPYINLCNKLPMSDNAIAYAADYLLPFDENSFTAEAFELVHALPIMQFNEVYNQVDTNKQEAYLAFLRSNQFDYESLAEYLSQNLSWPKASIKALLIAWNGKNSGKQRRKEEAEITPIKVVAMIEKLWHCFTAAQQNTLSVITLNEFVQLIDSTDWKNLTEHAERFKIELEELNSAGQKERYKNASAEVLEKERDSLMHVALWHFNQGQGYIDINTPDHLSDFLLCDVEMSGIMQVTPLQEATDAVQTYLTRCKSGMEKVDAVKLKNITPSEWQWVSSFELWQSEQLIKTYPENYLQATVRSTASLQFSELVEELSKNELSEVQAETAVLDYLDEWVNLENAKIVDVSCYKTYSRLYEKEVETFFIVSRSVTEENTFYYSRKECDTENERSTWFPWKKIEINILSETVSAVYAFNRLNIFWSEISNITDTFSDPLGETKEKKSTKCNLYYIAIKAIYQNLDGSWTHPLTICKHPFYLKPEEGIGPFDKKIPDMYSPSNPYWRKIGVQPLVESATGSNTLMLFYGPISNVTDIYIHKSEHHFSYVGNDERLVELIEFYDKTKTLIDKIAPSKYPSQYWKGLANLIAPTFLNSSLMPANLVSSDLPVIYRDHDAKYPMNFGFSEHILYNIEYDNVLVQNYQGTYSKWANSVENSRKICQVRSNNLFAVRNRVGAIYMNNGNVGYLFCLKISEIALEAFTIENSKCRVDINKYVDCLMVDFSYNLDLSDREKFSVERFFSNVVSELREKACTHIESVMNRAIQQEELGLPKTRFSDLKPNLELVMLPKEDSDDKIDFTGPYGIYAREFFFHTPMAVAASLAGSFKYTAARNWYHKVFNVLGVEEKNKKEVWQYLPFYDHKSADLSIMWNKGDKKICFSNGVKTAYFSNAQPYIAFDDSNGIIYVLCTQIYNTTESLYLLTSLDGGNEWEYLRSLIQVVDSQKAMGIIVSPNRLTLYYNGNKMIHSEIISIFWSKEETVSYIPQWAQLTTIETTRKTNTLDPDIIADSNPEVFMRWTLEQYIRFILEAADRQFIQESWESLSAATQLYFEAEDLLGGKPPVQDLESEYEKETKRTYENVQNVNVSFMKPTNRNLKSLWDWVNDRLYKLRNGLNINGERQLPSMNNDAEIPWRLVLNLRNGRVNLNPTEELFSSKTIYRFRDLLPATETMINMLSEFGNQLYGALTQKDNEQLQALQATHQVNLLNTTKNLYDYQVNEATKDLEALRVNALSVQAQYNYYSGLIAEGNLPQEILSIGLNASASVYQFAGAVTNAEAVVPYLMPNIFGLADGGMQYGQAVSTVAASYTDLASGLQTTSQILATQAEYIRRNEEWLFQQDQSLLSLAQLNKNIEAAQVRQNIAIENRNLYYLQVKQANEVLNYLNTKFTNAELYSWISGRMSSLYFTAYQLALSSLQKLQAAYNYELDLEDNEQDNFIPSKAWNSVKKGLLAGESLKLALASMQNAYLNKNVRKQQAEKILSLKQNTNGDSWQKFTKGGSEVLEFDIDRDLIGNKEARNLKIKSISVSIPAVLGPYETFDAILENKATNERVTISRGIDDYGVFPEDMQDGRYMPFEGLLIPEASERELKGTWKFTISSSDIRSNLADIILSVKYYYRRYN